jgi:hypothetical protein
MKKTFWIYKSLGIGNFISEEKLSCSYDCIGTTELEVIQPLKEVVKEIQPTLSESAYDGERMMEARWIPKGAYDVKIVYKIKE